MHFEYTPYIIPIIFSLSISGSLSAWAWKHRQARGASWFSMAMLASFIFNFFYGLEIVSTNLAQTIFWSKMQYFGVAPIAIMWVFLVMVYTGEEKRINLRNIILIFIIPGITFFLVWTNELHELIWVNPFLEIGPSFSLLGFGKGIWWWVNTFYMNSLFMMATYMLIKAFGRPEKIYNQQIITLLIFSGMLWGGVALYVMGIMPQNINPLPFVFPFGGIIIAWGLFRYSFLDITPVTKETIINKMQEGLIVLDTQLRVTEINPAAQRIVGKDQNEVIGKEITEVLANYKEIEEKLCKNADDEEEKMEQHVEITLPVEDMDIRTFDIRTSMLLDKREHPIGRLMFWRDITERAKEESATNLLLVLTQEIDKVQSLSFAFNKTLEIIVEHASWIFGEVWIPNKAGNQLENGNASYCLREQTTALENFNQISQKITFAPNEGLPGRVWASKEIEWQKDTSALSKEVYLRAEYALKANLRTALGIPVLDGGKVIAVLIFYSDKVRAKDQYTIDLLSVATAQLGVVLESKRAEELVQINRARYRDIFMNSPVALWEADFSTIKTRLDHLAKENGDIESYILQNPASMEGAASSVHLLDANLEAVKLYEAQNVETLLKSLHKVITPQAMLALRDGVIALWQEKSNSPIESIHKTLNQNDINVVIRFSVRDGYEDTWEYVNISIDDVTEARTAETSVRQLASAVEASGSSIVITDMDGAIEYVNPAFSRVTGYSREEAMGKNPRVLKSGQHPAKFYQEMWEILGKGETWSGEIINKKKNGDLYWEQATISPVKNDIGKTAYYVAVKDDITAAKETGKALKESEATFRSFVKQSSEGIVFYDSQGYIIEWNDALTEISGIKAEDSIGMHGSDLQFLTLAPEEKTEEYYAEIKDSWSNIPKKIKEGTFEFVSHYIHPLYRSDGTKRITSQTFFAVETGNSFILCAFISDITEQYQNEETLRNLSSATEQSASAVVIADMNGLVEYINPAFTEITGYSKEEILGNTLQALRSGEHEENFYNNRDDIIAHGEVWRGEIINKRKDGSLYWESQVISPMENDQGEITHYVSVRDDITGEKEAEAEIQRQHEFLQNVIDGIDSPFYVLNVDDYSIALANEKARSLGVVRGNTCYKLAHKRDTPCDGKEHPCPIKQVLQHKEAFSVEHIHYRSDGTPYYVEVHGYPIFDKNGDVVQMIEYSIDITERKKAEEELRKLSSAAEQAASGIMITNTKGVIEFANPAALKITGYSAEEFIGSTPNLLKSGRHDTDFYQNLWGTIRKGDVWRGELINQRKDGSLYWESQSISSVKNDQGEVTHYVAVKEDISKAKEAEKEIRTLSSATAQTASGIVITDKEGRVEFINPAFSAISGYELEDILGKTLDIQRSDEHDEAFYAQLDATIARGEIWKGEIINKRKNGSLYWEAQVISPIMDDEGNISHHVLAKEDITRRKELEQSLALAHEKVLRASDMKTQLLANVSHDMRTPLGAILGYTEMLDADVFGKLNDEQAEATRAIAASSQRLLNFVSDLLNQAQIETGEIVLNESLFEPQRLLNGLGGEISLAKTQGLIINTLVGDNLPKKITGDTYWLGQIIHNLLSNAIKFTQRGGEISIRLLRSGDYAWKLEVEDNGKGIPQEAQAYIFESFRQVDGSITREAHTGSGLGLSIVNHLVRLMRGEIRLESELGKGSKFIVLLPLKKNKE